METEMAGSKYEAPRAVRLSNAKGAAAAYCAAGSIPSTDYCTAGTSAPTACTQGNGTGTACTGGFGAPSACSDGTTIGF